MSSGIINRTGPITTDLTKSQIEEVKRTCFVGVLQLVLHIVCCYILAPRTFNLNTKCCWFQKKQDSMCFSFQLHRHVVFLLAFTFMKHMFV